MSKRIDSPKCNFCCSAFKHKQDIEHCTGCVCFLSDAKYYRGSPQFDKECNDHSEIWVEYPDGHHDIIKNTDLRYYLYVKK